MRREVDRPINGIVHSGGLLKNSSLIDAGFKVAPRNLSAGE